MSLNVIDNIYFGLIALAIWALMPIILDFASMKSLALASQLIMDLLEITPEHTTCTLVVIETILGGLGLYDPLVNLAGAGAGAFIPKHSCNRVPN